MFEKLYKYIGKDIKTLIDRPDASYVVRLQKNRVFYVREDIMRRATNVSLGATTIPAWPQSSNNLQMIQMFA